MEWALNECRYGLSDTSDFKKSIFKTFFVNYNNV